MSFWPIAFVVLVLPVLAADTCRRPCRLPAGAASDKEAKDAGTSRCFRHKTDRDGGESFECFVVNCSAGPRAYALRSAHGALTLCGEETGAGAWRPSGPAGLVRCEALEEVCQPAGDVLLSEAELRLERLREELRAAHGSSAAEILLDAVHDGRFVPHMDEEDGFPGRYLVSRRSAGCWRRLSTTGEQQELGQLDLVVLSELDTAQLLEVLSSSCTLFVEQDAAITTQSVPWGLDSVDGMVDGVYSHRFTGRGVDVYVIDTGIDSQHEELLGRVLPGSDFTDSALKSTEDNSTDGHGTHCAGIIAGKLVGVAPGANLIPLKVIADDGRGLISWVTAALDVIVEEKQRRLRVGGNPMVAVASFSSPRSTLVNTAFRRVVASGVTVVVSAGNGNVDAGTISPASERTVLTVGAVDYYGVAANFSNFGPFVDFWGPGVDIVSAQAGGGLITKSGTSAASPFVAGVAALMLEAHPMMSPDDIRTELSVHCSLGESGDALKRTPGLVVRTFANPGGLQAIAPMSLNLSLPTSGCLVGVPMPTSAPATSSTLSIALAVIGVFGVALIVGVCTVRYRGRLGGPMQKLLERLGLAQSKPQGPRRDFAADCECPPECCTGISGRFGALCGSTPEPPPRILLWPPGETFTPHSSPKSVRVLSPGSAARYEETHSEANPDSPSHDVDWKEQALRERVLSSSPGIMLNLGPNSPGSRRSKVTFDTSPAQGHSHPKELPTVDSGVVSTNPTNTTPTGVAVGRGIYLRHDSEHPAAARSQPVVLSPECLSAEV